MARVFVSSRFGEFEVLRKLLARRFPRITGFNAVALDDGLATPLGPEDRSIQEVRKSDVLLVLCGDSYADWPATDGRLSTTHKECREAIALGIPLLVYATEARSRDPRVQGLLEELMLGRVVGKLTGDDDDDADRILDALELWFGTLDEDGLGPGATLVEQIEHELMYLGAAGLASWTLPGGQAQQQPMYTQLVERRQLALKALAAGEVSAARQQLEHAHDIYPLDWATDYLLARLLEVRGLTTDMAAARRLAKFAHTGVDDVAHAPQSLGDLEETRTRRLVATLNLRARLARLSGECQEAKELAEGALETAPTSRDALVERVRAYAGLGDLANAQAAGRELLKIYPDRAVTLMRSQDLAELQPELERALVRTVVDRQAYVDRLLGTRGTSAERPPKRLRTALDNFREATASATRQLAVFTDQVAELLELELSGPSLFSTRYVVRMERAVTHHAATEAQMLRLVERRGELDALLAQVPGDDGQEERARGLRSLDEGIARARSAVEEAKGKVPPAPKPGAGWGNLGFSVLAALVAYIAGGIVGGIVRSVVRLFGPDWPSWPFILPAVAFALVALNDFSRGFYMWAFRRPRRARAIVALDSARAHLAQLQEQRRILVEEAREEERTRVRRHNLEREAEELDEEIGGCRADLEDAALEIIRARDQSRRVAETLGIEGEDFVAIGVELKRRYVVFNSAFSVFPNWCFPEYVPVRRAQEEDLTRVDETVYPRLSGGWLADCTETPRRIVRLVGAECVSDVAAVCGRYDAQLDGLESVLREVAS